MCQRELCPGWVRKGKKLKISEFMNWLDTVREQPMKEQHDALKRKFIEWKGDYSQIDDVLVIGVKFDV